MIRWSLPQEGFRYPPPELGPEYVEPETFFPPVREVLPPWGDVAVLALGLVLASWLALRLRSRRGLWLLAVAAVIYIGFIREGCVCAVGSLQNVAHSLADPSAPILIGTVLFFALPLVATLFFGRGFCAAVCPLGAVQELTLIRPTRVPAWLDRALAKLAVVYLALAVLFAATGSAYIICRYDPFVGFFRLGATSNMLVVGGCILLIGFFIGRPYCRYLCPYGVLLGWISRLSWKRVRIAPAECVNCRLCEDACPYGAITESNLDVRRGDPRRGRWTLVAMLVLLPVWVAGLGWGGAQLAPLLATAHHRVALAEQIDAEEAGLTRETTDPSDAFRASGESVEALRKHAAVIRAGFTTGTLLAGAFVGLIIGLELIGLSMRRRRDEYEAHRELCVACGRCFASCPVQAGDSVEISVGRPIA